MSNTNPVVLSPVTVNDELKKTVGEALNPESIRAAIIAEAEKQTAAASLNAAEQAAAEAERLKAVAATEVKQFTRTVAIGGREFEFTADSELELERMENNALKVAFAVRENVEPTPAVAAVDPAIAAAEAQKKSEEDAARKAELELQFKRGEISTADYLDQSGAFDDILAKRGISSDALKSAVDRNDASAYEQSWAEATEAFKTTAAGSDWPGGSKNVNLMGMQIVAMQLEDAPDKVAALAQAYTALKEQGMLFPGEAIAAPAAPAVPAAATTIAPGTVAAPAAPTAPVVAPRLPSHSSSLFGASSGVSGAVAPGTSAPKTIDIPKDASPAEIMEAWKAAQISSGKNPDEAFKETFQARRV